jgi:phosphatidylserine/phosphatidylglycerophosphate/cardiolipin synthase-like enzyme
MNFTNNGAYADNNNLMRINSNLVAEDYETEFDEMFVDDKFGAQAGTITPNPRVTIDGTPLDIYFSPDDHVQAALIDLLDNAQSSINFLAFSFTADPLGEAIRQRAAAGVKVSGVMEAEQVASNQGTEYDAFRAAGLDVHLDGNRGQMHHKVMIIDGQIVVMGSYNFTASAETTNDENLIVIYNSDIAAQYQQEFKRVYAQARP